MKRNNEPNRFEHERAARIALWALIGFGLLACSSGSKSSSSNNAGNTSVGDNGGTSGGGGTAGSAGAITSTAGGGASNGGEGGGGANSGGTAGSSGSGGAGAGGEPSMGMDAGTDGGVACPADAILCDDFESYMTPADLTAAWKVTETMASVVVDTSNPHSGARGLHITSSGDTPVGVIIKENAPLFPIDGNVFYGRMMMWLTEAPTGAVHWNNIQSAGYLPEGSTQWSKYGWGGMYGTILAGYTIRNNPTDMQAVTDCSKPSQLGLPEKIWSCIEWEFDGAGNQMHLWIDNDLVADADIITTGTQCVTPQPPNNTWQAPTFSNLTLGWMQYQQSTTPIELWLDDVVVTTKRRVGCPPRKVP